MTFELKEIITLLKDITFPGGKRRGGGRIFDWRHSFDRREVRVVAALLSSVNSPHPAWWKPRNSGHSVNYDATS
ncbi:hypothetical protein ABTY00_32420 [Streptomyces microflavus]|uniref:hypothetical protein n=1 Tax=Streptomyces microflavus TaxID=1919 RepID=UPI00332402CA